MEEDIQRVIQDVVHHVHVYIYLPYMYIYISLNGGYEALYLTDESSQ